MLIKRCQKVDVDRQVHALTEAGCIRFFAGKKPGTNAEREELRKALDFFRAGDTLVVPSPHRLGRSLQNRIAIVSGLRRHGVGWGVEGGGPVYSPGDSPSAPLS
ncbi:recombinase family protein [Streptomyces sp. NBC_00481]|uniref:recombinase family protein n=1 Tax=Streptomyces sp. NBC_00481 TaxID=2975755 RepID=UPI002DD9B938|nr:recombinase family protein [Streptomyces sp. NBC_00481]WRY97746.1 recombinase family protein [Streptomyces sp. NBC_00481]